MRRYDWDRLLLCLDVPIELKAIGPAMSQFGNADGSKVKPGYELLANAFNLSVRTIQEYVAVLVELKLLWVVRRGGGRRNPHDKDRVTEFQLTEPADGMLPKRLDTDLRPIAPRTPGKAPVRAIEASRRAAP